MAKSDMSVKVQGSIASEKPTANDALNLGIVYGSLSKALKAYKSAERDVSSSWAKGEAAIKSARIQRNAALQAMDAVYSESWIILSQFPRGTTAQGGATPQTVALQFFNANLNRELKARLTGADARRINARSFA